MVEILTVSGNEMKTLKTLAIPNSKLGAKLRNCSFHTAQRNLFSAIQIYIVLNDDELNVVRNGGKIQLFLTMTMYVATRQRYFCRRLVREIKLKNSDISVLNYCSFKFQTVLIDNTGIENFRFEKEI